MKKIAIKGQWVWKSKFQGRESVKILINNFNVCPTKSGRRRSIPPHRDQAYCNRASVDSPVGAMA